MRTRSQSRNNFPQQEASPVIVKPLRIELPFLKDQFQEDPPPEVSMADNRTMAKLHQAPTEGYEDAIFIPEIAANTFELKHGLINLVQNKQFFGQDKEDPHAHIRYFNKITSTIRDSLNSAAGGNFLDKKPRECLKIIESKSKVRQSRAKAVVAKEIFKDMSFEISFTDALIVMPKFASTLKALIGNKEKLSEMARTPMNEHYLDASINLMPFSVWEALSLPELTPNCMTLELADRSVAKPIGIAKDVSFKVGVFDFPADFMVVDFEPDPRVPLILERCFLKTGQALIDVHKGELTLRIGNEAITYNLEQTVRYSANYIQMTAKKIDVIEMAYKEYSQEVLGFFDVTASGNPTPYDDPIVSTTNFLLFEEADAFLGLEDDPNSPKINPFYYDPEGDILLLEAIRNSEPLPLLPNNEQYLPSFKKELKVCEAKTVKSSVDEPPEVELKDLPPHLEYVFQEADNKLPVIIAKELGDEEKSALIKDLSPTSEPSLGNYLTYR
nr:reverse transcriptase domain-containing protein [Tanacetum cinerariifolium]